MLLQKTPKSLLESLFNYLEIDSTEVRKGLDTPIYKSKPKELPSNIQKMLENMYDKEIHQLSVEYGDYFLKWKNELFNNTKKPVIEYKTNILK